MRDTIFSFKTIIIIAAALLINLALFVNVFVLGNYSNPKIGGVLFAAVLVFSVVLVRRVYMDGKNARRVNDLAAEIAEVYERLAVMESQRTEFISIASHQLRAPLTVIKGYASMVLEGTFGGLSESVHDAMDKLYRSSERIVELVDGLLAVSRIEEGHTALSLKAVNFSKFVQSVLAEIEYKVKAAGLELLFTVEDQVSESFVDIDEAKLRSVIVHIIDNAMEFTKAPGRIHVSLELDTIAQKIILSISDTGIGMSTEQIKALFERFDLKITGSGEISSPGGRARGMGIYVAKEIVHAHHGYFMAESDGVNMGTTFTIQLSVIPSP